MTIGFVIPVFNDWISLSKLMTNIHTQVRQYKRDISCVFFLVNDCSTEDYGDLLSSFTGEVQIINLYNNVGHQRALALGLCYANDNFKGDYLITMDADGEDQPQDIPRLIEASIKENKIVFASRRKRSEGIVFRIFYQLYKLVFQLLTGNKVTFGNYSVIPFNILPKVVRVPEIWNQYSAAIIRSRIPYSTVSTARGLRYDGKSKMNFYSLIVHGFSAFSIYSDIISARAVFFTVCIILSSISVSVVVLYRKFVLDIASPGWATSAILGLATISMLSLLFSFVIGLLVLNSRNQGLYNPSKNYKDFIHEVVSV